MATANLSGFLRNLTRAMGAQVLAGDSDRQLVERALARHDDAAFEAIVTRHGPMVYRVCWRVLQHPQDAEDAFQATFLLLAQKLRTLRQHASLALRQARFPPWGEKTFRKTRNPLAFP